MLPITGGKREGELISDLALTFEAERFVVEAVCLPSLLLAPCLGCDLLLLSCFIILAAMCSSNTVGSEKIPKSQHVGFQ